MLIISILILFGLQAINHRNQVISNNWITTKTFYGKTIDDTDTKEKGYFEEVAN